MVFPNGKMSSMHRNLERYASGEHARRHENTKGTKSTDIRASGRRGPSAPLLRFLIWGGARQLIGGWNGLRKCDYRYLDFSPLRCYSHRAKRP